MLQNRLAQVEEVDENEVNDSQIEPKKSFKEEEKKIEQSDILVTVPSEFINSGFGVKI